MPSLSIAAGTPKPSFQPSGASPASMRRRRSVSCASIPRSILGSRAMAGDSATARARGSGSGDLEEADRDVAQADLVAVGEHRLSDALAVDEDAVEAAVVEHHDGVPAGDGEVLEHDVGGRRAAEAQRSLAELDDHELGAVFYGEVAAGGQPRNGERAAAVALAGVREVVGDEGRHVGGTSENGGHGGQSPGRIQALSKRLPTTS